MEKEKIDEIITTVRVTINRKKIYEESEVSFDMNIHHSTFYLSNNLTEAVKNEFEWPFCCWGSDGKLVRRPDGLGGTGNCPVVELR
jgi:hypothetical protein